MIERQTHPDEEFAISLAEMGGAPEIDLHGRDAVDAELETERFLSQAYACGESVVKIIHGKGTGTLRRAVERLLGDHPLVSYSRGSMNPGELGAVAYAALRKRI